MKKQHEWKYCSLGGVVRVMIDSGDDIEHLGELDQKMWTALSCPVKGLEMDKETLEYLDTDHDGKIRVGEVVQAAEWLCSVIKDKDSILRGESTLALDNINTNTVEGRRLYDSAIHILSSLKKDKSSISIADSDDTSAIYAGTSFNGDGIISPSSAGEDSQLKDTIATIASISTALTDRSGEPGIDANAIETFYAACADYSAWQKAAQFPFKEKTSAVYSALNALKDKVADFYKRCALLRYDSATAAAVSVSVTEIDKVGDCPIATIRPDGVMPIKDINPVWQPKLDALLDIVGTICYEDGISEQAWADLCARFDGYSAWQASKKGAAVEALGLEKVESILQANRKADLLELIEKDKAFEAQSAAIEDVKKLMHLYRDFAQFLANYVIFTDFYARDPKKRAIFELGKLYIDQRCCDLCIRVSDMAQHADMAKLSGMFLIYCKCTSLTKAQTMDIVAVMTDGGISELRPGKNGIFYDQSGNDWDAVITKIVDNPISIKQAFWSPYRKFWEFCVGLINKSANDKEGKVTADMQKMASGVKIAEKKDDAASAPKSAFDIAKFAGIFAALGMALGYIGKFITDIAKGVSSAAWYELLLAIAAILIVISGPSCFIAWSKLRRRNLGPVLNANGWAINSRVLVNILFGAKLTSVAKYPKLNLHDPYAQKCSAWKWILLAIVLIAILFLVLYLTHNLAFLGL